MPAHLLLTEPLADEIAAAVSRGIPLEVVAQRAGVARQTIQQWLQSAETGVWTNGETIPDQSLAMVRAFRDKIKRARAEHFAQMVASIQECATTPNLKTGMPDWRAADVMLSKHPSYRRMWHEERHTLVEQSGTVNHEHHLVKALDEDALEAAYKALPDAAPLE